MSALAWLTEWVLLLTCADQRCSASLVNALEQPAPIVML